MKRKKIKKNERNERNRKKNKIKLYKNNELSKNGQKLK